MEAAKRMKSEVDSLKKRLRQKVEEVKEHLKEKVPEETEMFLRKTTDMRGVLESRVNSFTESHSRYQGMAENEQSREADKLFQADADENRTLLEESKEMQTSLQNFLDYIREKEKKALTKELEQIRAKEVAQLQRENQGFVENLEKEKAVIAKGRDEERL